MGIAFINDLRRCFSQQENSSPDWQWFCNPFLLQITLICSEILLIISISGKVKLEFLPILYFQHSISSQLRTKPFFLSENVSKRLIRLPWQQVPLFQKLGSKLESINSCSCWKGKSINFQTCFPYVVLLKQTIPVLQISFCGTDRVWLGEVVQRVLLNFKVKHLEN